MTTMKIMNPYSCLLMVLLCFMISVISTTLLGGGVVAQELSTRVAKLQEVPKDRCGKDFGGAVCSDGRCCSEYGWCGTTATYCGIGCQSQCHDVKYECGWQAKGAKCEEGLCCSNYGFCGNTTAYCANGNCQSQCHTVNPLSTRVTPHEVPEGRCGRDFGCALCSDGNCCSEYGWCGTTATYCGIGCQSQCQDVKYDCGWQAKGAKCEEGLCCSIYGFCGNTSANCADGNCQSQCHAVTSLSTAVAPREVPEGRCGRDFGCALCSDGSCCSEYGWCGTTATYCGIGCQSQCQDVKYECGWQAKGAKCEEGLCCSVYGFCGNTTAYCAKGNCQSQCTATLEGGNKGNFIELPLGTS